MPIIHRLIPFIFLGIALVAFAVGIFILSYLLLFGALVGLILFTITWVKELLTHKKKPEQPKKIKGRVIDSDDWKKL